MQLPLIGKRQPAPWLLALLTVSIIGAGATTIAIVRQQSAVPDINALTETVESQPLTVRITASGKVQPVQTVNLSPKTTGILAELYVEQGDRVQQGQVIARMENASIQAERVQAQARIAQSQARLAELRAGSRPQEIAQRQAAVEQAQARVVEAQARLDRENERVERNRDLLQEGAISQDEFDGILNSAATARATLEQNRAGVREAQQQAALTRSGSRAEEIAAAEAEVAEARGQLQSIDVQLEDTIIRAPFNGIVTQKYATEGAFVTPTTSASEASSATSTAIVAVASGLEVLAEVPEVDINEIEPGQTVEVVADAYPTQVFQGRVRLVAPEAVVEQNVTSFQVRIDLTSGQDKLLSGMNVDVTFLGDRLDNALTVPTVAIVTKEGETGVLIPNENNRAEFRPVKLGTAVGNQTQVVEGLEPGDRVFIDLPADQKQEWIQQEE